MSYQYPLSTTALLMIDPFNDFLHTDGTIWPLLKEQAERVNLIENQAAALSGARAAGLTVIYVPHHRHRGGDYDTFKFLNPTHELMKRTPVFVAGEWGGNWLEELKPQEGDLECAEHWFQSGFQGTDLDYLLKQRGCDHLVLTGQRTNACFESTGRYGVELGYHVTLLTDATAAFTKMDMDGTFNNALTWAHEIVSTDQFLNAIRA